MNTKLHLLLFAFLFGSISQLFAQSITAPEPEFTFDAVYVLHGDSTIRLESQVPHSKTRASASTYIVGIGSAHVTFEVNGSESPIRIRQHGPIYFIVKLDNNSIDPNSIIQIIKMEKTSKTRRCEIANVNALGTSKTGDLTYIPYEAKKYGQSSYLIKVDQTLAPGEYGLNIDLQACKSLNLFGVDQ